MSKYFKPPLYAPGTMVRVSEEERQNIRNGCGFELPDTLTWVKHFVRPTLVLLHSPELDKDMLGHDGGKWHVETDEWNGCSHGHVYVGIQTIQATVKPEALLHFVVAPQTSSTPTIVNLVAMGWKAGKIAQHLGLSREWVYQKLLNMTGLSPDAMHGALLNTARHCRVCGKLLRFARKARYCDKCRPLSQATVLVRDLAGNLSLAKVKNLLDEAVLSEYEVITVQPPLKW